MSEELLGGLVFVKGQEEEMMRCCLDDLKAIGIQTNRWMIAAQDCTNHGRVVFFFMN